MSPSLTGDPTHLATGRLPKDFAVPVRKGFTIEASSMSSAFLSDGNATLAISRTPSFSRDTVLGIAQRHRNPSQSSDNNFDMSNGAQKGRNDEVLNPLKRRNVDAGLDYPRRRATIAVRDQASGRWLGKKC